MDKPEENKIAILEKKIEEFNVLIENATYENKYGTDYNRVYSDAEQIICEFFGIREGGNFRMNVTSGAWIPTEVDKEAEVQDYKEHLNTCITQLKLYKRKVERQLNAPVSQREQVNEAINENDNYFSKYKNKILNIKSFAVIALIFIVVGAIMTFWEDISSLYSKYYPKHRLEIYSEKKSFVKKLNEIIELPIQINFKSESKDIVNDLKFLYQLFSLRDIHPTDKVLVKNLKKYMQVLNDNDNYPPLGFENKSLSIINNIKFDKPGKYILVCFAKSIKLDISDSVIFDIIIEIPSFVVEDSVLLFPKGETISNYPTFKIIHQNEANNTIVNGSTLWFRSNYIGAMGGFFYEVYFPIDKKYRSNYEFPDNSLNLVGYLNEFHNTLAPIGNNTYKIKLIKKNIISFKKEKNFKRFLSIPIPGQIDTSFWFENLNDSIIVYASHGATGRHFHIDLTIRDTTYKYHESNETLNQYFYSDFPIYKKESKKNKDEKEYYIKIQIEDWSVNFSRGSFEISY